MKCKYNSKYIFVIKSKLKCLYSGQRMLLTHDKFDNVLDIYLLIFQHFNPTYFTKGHCIYQLFVLYIFSLFQLQIQILVVSKLKNTNTFKKYLNTTKYKY